MTDLALLTHPKDVILNDLIKALSALREASDDILRAIQADGVSGSPDLEHGITAHRLTLALFIVLKTAPVPSSVHQRVPGGITMKEMLELAVLEVERARG